MSRGMTVGRPAVPRDHLGELKGAVVEVIDLGVASILAQKNERIRDLERRLAFFAPTPEVGVGFSLEAHLGRVRRELFLEALARADGNQSKAALMLGITPQAVHKFVRTCGPGERGAA